MASGALCGNSANLTFVQEEDETSLLRWQDPYTPGCRGSFHHFLHASWGIPLPEVEGEHGEEYCLATVSCWGGHAWPRTWQHWTHLPHSAHWPHRYQPDSAYRSARAGEILQFAKLPRNAEGRSDGMTPLVLSRCGHRQKHEYPNSSMDEVGFSKIPQKRLSHCSTGGDSMRAAVTERFPR